MGPNKFICVFSLLCAYLRSYLNCLVTLVVNYNPDQIAANVSVNEWMDLMGQNVENAATKNCLINTFVCALG